MNGATEAVFFAGIDALGWALLHFLWQGALIGAVFALLMSVFAGGSARLRYAIGVSALAALTLTPLVTFCGLFDLPTAAPAGHAAVQAAPFTAPASDTAWWVSARRAVEQALPWLVLAWLAGVTLLSWRLARDWVGVRSLVRSSARALPQPWLATTERLRLAFGIRRPVRALESALVCVPMVVGWIRPVILIPPAALLGLTTQQLELLVAHELAHIRRFDHAVNLCQIVVETLLFYHPVVRWISGRIREERELCCDDLVVARTGEKLVYARALAEMEGLRSASPRMSVAADGGQLVSRINRLVTLPAPQRGTAHWLLGFLLVATGLSAMSVAHFRAAGPGPGVSVRPAALVPALTPIETREPLAVEPVTATQRTAAARRAAAGAAAVATAEAATAPARPAHEAAAPGTPAAPGPVAPVAIPEPAPQPPAVPASEPAPSEPGPQSVKRPMLAASADRAPETLRLARINEAAEPAAHQRETGLPEIPVPVPAAESDADLLTGGAPLIVTQPDFPRRALVNGIEGAVTVEFTVTGAGRVSKPRIVDAEPRGVFDREVLKTLDSWRFEPFRRNGAAVSQVITRTIEFRLDGDAHPDAGCITRTGSRLCRNLRTGTGQRDVEILQRAGAGRGLGVR